MSIINTLLLSANYELKNVDGISFSDYVLMDTYNKGNKQLRKIIIDNNSMQLAKNIIGAVNAGQSITMTENPIKFIDFRINNHKVDKIFITEIPDKTLTGEPKWYYLLNTNIIVLYPLPDQSYPYDITYISETPTMLDTDDSGYQTDVEQILVRYIVATLSGQPLDIAAEYQSISNLLNNIGAGETKVSGYYRRSGGGDY